MIAVAADATDEVGVTSVQFQLNGANLGAADTTPPYAVDWETTTVANGLYQLTAIAADAAGNSATSAVVNVTVANPVDTTPPTVESVTPADGAVDVVVDTPVTATFSEPMDPASIDGTTVELLDSGNNIVAASVGYDVSSRTATSDGERSALGELILPLRSTDQRWARAGADGCRTWPGTRWPADSVWSVHDRRRRWARNCPVQHLGWYDNAGNR